MSWRIFEIALISFIALGICTAFVSRWLRRPRNTGPAGKHELRRRWAKLSGLTLGAIAIANFLAYSEHAGELGGNADPSSDGRYFVSSHGRRTEVNEHQWRAVKFHQNTMFVTHAVGCLVGGALLMYSESISGKRGGNKSQEAESSDAETLPSE